VNSRIASYLILALAVILLINNSFLGVRAVGAAAILQGVDSLRSGRAPYGWRGLPPLRSGCLEAFSAALLLRAVHLMRSDIAFARTRSELSGCRHVAAHPSILELGVSLFTNHLPRRQ
jgi:hypothetical protein